MSGLDDIDIFDNPFRDPVMEARGYKFDPERNAYYEDLVHPEYGPIRSYFSPRDQSEVPLLSDARRSEDFRERALAKLQLVNDAVMRDEKRLEDLMSKGNLSDIETDFVTNRMDFLTKNLGASKRRQEMLKEELAKLGIIDEVQSMNRGGAVNINDEDIFEPTMEMLRRENRPQAPEVTVEQPMFSMPREDMRSTQDFGGGEREKISVQGTPGIDQVFTQVLTSPGFRSVVRIEDVPPQNLRESKKIFEFLVKQQGIDQAVQYLVDTFGKAGTFPIEKSLGPDPRTQIISGVEESRMSARDPMDRGIKALR